MVQTVLIQKENHSNTHMENVSGPGVEDADFLVLAGRDDAGSVVVPGGAQRDVGEGVDLDQSLPSTNVPDEELVVRA